MIRSMTMLLAITLGAVAGCGGSSSDGPDAGDSAKALTAFSLLVDGRSVPGRISEADATIALAVPGSVAVTALVATYSTTGTSVAVGAAAQQSGTSANDFTEPVVYTVSARDGSTADYVVTVSRAPGTIALARTGQTVAYDASATPRDDGALQRGITWPEPRFVLGSGDEAGCVTDLLTGLTWPAGDAWTKSWSGALAQVSTVNAGGLCGHTDWRLPNVNELRSLIDYSRANQALPERHPFVAPAASGACWSSTTYGGGSDSAYLLSFDTGAVRLALKSTSQCAWPVRGASTYAGVARTGQTKSYAANDDGALQAGVAWPASRFTVGSDTVTDVLTGLVWAQNANLMATRDLGWDQDYLADDGSVLFQHALDYVAKLNAEGYAGHSDWRLPNIGELVSLFNANAAIQNEWLNGAAFANVTGSYWSSTAWALVPTYWGWSYTSTSADSGSLKKEGHNGVWPVRAGP